MGQPEVTMGPCALAPPLLWTLFLAGCGSGVGSKGDTSASPGGASDGGADTGNDGPHLDSGAPDDTAGGGDSGGDGGNSDGGDDGGGGPCSGGTLGALSVAFSGTTIGVGSTQTLGFDNPCPYSVELTQVALSGSSTFTVSGLPLVVDPGDVGTLAVVFVASDYAPQTAELVLDWPADSASVALSGVADPDQDGDGAHAPEVGGDDCDDSDPGVHPGAPELPDGVDQDCDGTVDEMPMTARSRANL